MNKTRMTLATILSTIFVTSSYCYYQIGSKGTTFHEGKTIEAMMHSGHQQALADCERTSPSSNKLTNHQRICAPKCSHGRKRTSKEIIYRLCEETILKLGFCPDWSTTAAGIRTLDSLEYKIQRSYHFRKKYIRPLEDAFGQGYIDQHIKNTRQQLRQAFEDELQQKQEEKEKRWLASELEQEAAFDQKKRKRLLVNRRSAIDFETKREEHFTLHRHFQSTRGIRIISPNRLTRCYGNAIQNNIHEEIVAVVNRTTELLYANQRDCQVSDLADIVFRSADIALDFKGKHEYEKAYSFSDFCTSILDVVTRSIIAFPKGVWRGVNALSDSAKQLFDIATQDPLGTVQSIASGIAKHVNKTALMWGESLFRTELPLDEEGLPSLNLAVKQDLEKSRQIFSSYKSRLANALQRIYNNPEETITEGIGYATEFILSCGLCEIGMAKATGLVNALVKGVQTEAGLFKSRLTSFQKEAACISLATETQLAATAPLTMALDESGQILKFAAKETTKASRNGRLVKEALKIAKRSPSVIEAEGSAAKAVKDIVKTQVMFEESEGFQELARLIKKSKPTRAKTVGFQNEVSLTPKKKLIFRKDTGVRAHKIWPEYSHPIDHYNIEIHEFSGKKWIKTQKLHIVKDPEKGLRILATKKVKS